MDELGEEGKVQTCAIHLLVGIVFFSESINWPTFVGHL